MTDAQDLTAQFEQQRARLHAVAYRMLGSADDAEDAVQEAWLRLRRSGADDIANLAGWLTTVVARICLDVLRSRRSRADHPPIDAEQLAQLPAAGPDPEAEAVLGAAMGPALLLVLERLSPAERVAFVLHDLFDVPFDEVARVVGRSPDAVRQLASRGRRRVRSAGEPSPDMGRERRIVSAFLAASRRGDFEALVSLLDPDVVLRADAATVALGAQPEVRGPREVAATFAGRARAARPALVDGVPGLVWSQAGAVRVVFRFAFTDASVSAIELVSDPEVVARLDIVPLADG